MHTRLYCKESDTHCYVPPSSCHPYHIVRNNPSQIARRVRKLCSEEESYTHSKEEYSEHLYNRGYAWDSITEAFEKFDKCDRVNLFTEKAKVESERCYPLITEYNPHLPAVAPVLHKHKPLLKLDAVVDRVIPQDSIFTSHTQPKNIKSLLTCSTFISDSNASKPIITKGFCSKCTGCILCNLFLVETDSFSSFQCSNSFPIKFDLTCTTEGIIYLINDKICNMSYIGSTIGTMRIRFNNYRNHIRIEHDGCEIAKHFSTHKSVELCTKYTG